MAWYWGPVAERLERAGHEAIALELPADDPHAGLTAYTQLALQAVDGCEYLVVAAQSMGAFTAFPLCARRPVRHLVLLNAMVPAPGERATDWWEATRSEEARRAAARERGYPEDFELETYFFHDLPPDVIAQSGDHVRDEADIAFEEPCPFDAYPDVPTTVLAGRDDRLFPFALQDRVARERLGIAAQPVPGGHLNALSEPDAVVRALPAT